MMEDNHETSPLLGRPVHKPPRHRTWILFLVCVVIVTIDFGSFLAIAPQTQLLETIICRRLAEGQPITYPGLPPDSPTDGSPCKSLAVQSELALINGWKDTLDALPGIILALLYGFMADRIGRKKVTLMSMCGLLMEEAAVRVIYWYSDYIPPRALWFTPLFQIYGGGSQVVTSMVFTIIADIYTVENRANIFFIVSAAVLIAEILATPLSAWMMTRSLWAPFLLGMFCEVCGVLAALALPETLPTVDSANDEASEDSETAAAPPSTWKERLRHGWSQLAHLTTYIWGSRNSLAISVAFLTASVGRQSLQLMLQYVSKRFAWSMAEASFLISLKGCINLVGLLVILPLVSRYLRRYLSPVTMDLRLTQASGAILVSGFGIMALAGHPAVFALGVSVSALGWGFYSTLRSVASALVDESQNGILNTTIGLVQGVGIMTAGPLLASAFRYGMRLEGVWLGLPYMVGTGLFFIAGWATWAIRIERAVERRV